MLAKILVELPRALASPLAALIAAYFLIDFEANFFILLGIMWLLSLAVASYSVALGAAVSDPEQAQQLAPLVLVPQLLFAGLFVPISAIPDFISWAQYICVLKYAINLGTLAEFGDCEVELDLQENLPTFNEDCTRILEQNDIDEDYLFRDLGIIVAVFLVFRGLSLLLLVIRARYFSQ